ncbi:MULTISPECIES: APC family permease [Pacificimonas]|nr:MULTISPECIES: amino acid permease [Pacificimonas]MBZ6379959.1 amino acid permease [Pacificimonas aurantium]
MTGRGRRIADDAKANAELSRSISPFMLAVYGLGTILGAGIYVVVGKIIGEAGALAPFAFLAAAAAAALTAFSYAELSARVPESGGSSAFVAHGFDRKWLTAVVGWALVGTGIVSAATIATGFVGYLGEVMSVSKWWAVPALVGALTFVAAIGVKQSAWFMGLTTAAGLIGLLYVLWFTVPNLAGYPAMLGEAWSEGSLPGGRGLGIGILLAAFLAFYAFIGFEDLVTLAEEAENPQRSLPKAIFAALVISLIFYVLIAAAAVSTLSADRLDESAAPLVDVVKEEGRSGYVLTGLSLLIIVNGALAQIVMASRVIHDLGKRRGVSPSWLSHINGSTHTPLLATVISGAVVTALALFLPTEQLASLTSYIILGVFFAANAALVKMKRDGIEAGGGVRTYPVWVPIGGMIACVLLVVGEAALGGGGH